MLWDNAPSHAAKFVRNVGLPLIRLPACAPELNPAEQVIRQLRRAAEGEVHGEMERKVAPVEMALRTPAADPVAVRRLVGWDWLIDALAALTS
jgi:hypothetical protein